PTMARNRCWWAGARVASLSHPTCVSADRRVPVGKNQSVVWTTGSPFAYAGWEMQRQVLGLYSYPMHQQSAHERAQAQVYHDNASEYDEINAGKVRTFDRKANMVAAAIRAAYPGPVRILEVGCGTGLFTAHL